MKIVVYGADYCPYCTKAKSLLETRGKQFTWVDTETPEGDKQRAVVAAKHNWQTIPMIFVDDKFVGGYDDMCKKLKNGELVL